MAIGDAENDISMLKFAKYKVAMKNANDSVKKIANFITKSCEEDGVAFAIEKVLNIANN
jgi:hydroxymethylpyrimidine pyrophosphatase-like HAD family hydrolase